MIREDEAPTESFAPIRTRERRRVKLSAALAAVSLVVLGVASYEVAAGLGHSSQPAASRPAVVVASTSAASSPAASSPAASPPAASPPAVPTPAASTASASPSPSPSPSPTSPPRALKPASASPVGPDGAKGDDPAGAANAIDGITSTPWDTDWYATPEFGGLQTGTGLLIDMGRTVTITSVRITLASSAGADFELQAGDVATLAHLSKVADSAGAGGTVRLSLAKPVQARYLLLWFTKLPPDGAGHYMAKVYNIVVYGRPSAR
jgi:hypothetical protein